MSGETLDPEQCGGCQLVVRGQSKELDKIREFIGQAARQSGLPEAQIFQAQLSVDEACANIIDHAYQDMEPGEIRICCDWTPDELRIIIRDQGEPFDPAQVPAPNLSKDLETRRPGGLGLYFMYKMMDQVRFDFDSTSWNTLVMVKKIAPPKDNA